MAIKHSRKYFYYNRYRRIGGDMETSITDIDGKDIGKLILRDDVEEILMTTGVSLFIIYEAKDSAVIAYLA